MPVIVNISSSGITRTCELLLPGWWTTIILIFPFKTHPTSFPFLSFQYSLKIQLHFLTDNYYQWLTAQICIYFTSVVIFVLIGYLGDDIISCMASVEIPFPSVVYVMFNYCYVIVYVQIEKYNIFKLIMRQCCYWWVHFMVSF